MFDMDVSMDDLKTPLDLLLRGTWGLMFVWTHIFAYTECLNQEVSEAACKTADSKKNQPKA